MNTTIVSTTGDTGKTALKYFLEAANFVTEVTSWTKTELADAGGTGPRIICYAKEEDVVDLLMPQEYEVFPPQAKGLRFFVPAHARTGGVRFKFPIAAGYMDGC